MALTSLHQMLGVLETQENWHTRRHFQAVLACWSDVVGPAVTAQTRPISIQRQVLQVATSSSAWAQNLMFERQRILAKLNGRVSSPLTDIRFSTALWKRPLRSNAAADETSEQIKLWQAHPSRVALPETEPSRLPNPPLRDPKTAFDAWAKQVQARSRQLPLCPTCHCPTPPGELQRWAVCSLCAAKGW